MLKLDKTQLSNSSASLPGGGNEDIGSDRGADGDLKGREHGAVGRGRGHLAVVDGHGPRRARPVGPHHLPTVGENVTPSARHKLPTVGET